jgi:hypothetical protein
LNAQVTDIGSNLAAIISNSDICSPQRAEQIGKDESLEVAATNVPNTGDAFAMLSGSLGG